MSTVQATNIKHNASSNNNIVLDSGGNATFTGTAVMASSFLRNRIINGDMRIDQRNGGASVTPADGQYTLDRWIAFRSQANRYSVRRNAGAVTPPTGFSNYLGVTSLSSYTPISNDYFGIAQYIEGVNVVDLAWGTAAAQPITVSFWARSSLTGTFNVSFRNNFVSSGRGYLAAYTISAANTWEYKTITIPGDTSGTWLTDTGLGIRIWFDLGDFATGTAGSWGSSIPTRTPGSVVLVGTNGATFYVTGVQVEAGSAATPFERRQFTQELQLCQRYFQKLGFNTDTAPSVGTTRARPICGMAWSTSFASGPVRLPVTMRVTPTAVFFRGNEVAGPDNTFNILTGGGGWQNATTTTLSEFNDDVVEVTVSRSATFSINDATLFNGGLTLNAEI